MSSLGKLLKLTLLGILLSFSCKFVFGYFNVNQLFDHEFIKVFPNFKGNVEAKIKYPTVVYAIGDIHGDFPNALDVLSAAGVVSPVFPHEWTAGNATLVQTGDVVDRGPDTRKLFRWFNDLHKQAEKHGGRVVRLLGNHEFMNAKGDWRYVHPGDKASYPEPSEENRIIDWGHSGEIGNLLLSEYNVTYKDNTTGSHFMHAGLSPEWAYREETVNELGKELLSHFMSREKIPEYLEDFWAIEGPMWYRGLAQLSEEEACEVALNVTKTLNVNRLVMGHTPQFHGIVSRCEGRILLIDTGLCSAYAGERAVLRISQNDTDSIVEAVYRGKIVKL
ncbi:vacuolar endopolyphosphatase [Schizosaccharomyces pombe]|uniref:Uncharacterized protein C1840.07c n=1 Tax=Schizosaccharomyces pombe (strain 972 / ATCC 24843) TaxID=284812 RepID=YQJ7_SCHPO|nr:putative phosphoprotein phosphatase [Schizosaccharomyces pombe]O74480.1 RecName: Full=Uncharacterized protein C1840.07c; Flags: Precursor [Schizosaccharomyces pombe 972h-]CAA20130.1 phosphoprotein phosphatase (predicted) [Schizosaccharomyces pombe]|eukprot:NP_588506.1 putative phosphoprotein phosphatase [Schizosaccharomyces pombe]